MAKQMSLSPLNSELKWTQYFRGVCALIVAYVALRLFSLFTISKFLRFTKPYCFRQISLEEADIAWKTVHQPRLLFLGRAACLEFSLALVLFALSKGLSVVWCTGVKLKPFRAHAWVEIDGKPFHEPDYVEQDLKKSLTV